MKRFLAVIALFCLMSGCAKNREIEYSKEIFAMDTYMSITANGTESEKAVEASIEEIKRLENLFSAEIETSDIHQINQSGKKSVSEETWSLLKRGVEIGKETDYAFNPCLYPLMFAWGFTNEEYQVLSQEQINQLLEQTNVIDLKLSKKDNQVTLKKEGMGIDLGGIAKGYTSTRIMEIFQEYKISSGMVRWCLS